MMHVTVALCTWNRSRLLDQTLTQMRNLRIPPGVTWELLVVNNNSTDDTDAVIEKHAQALPLRRLHEPKQGHCHARNCAIAAATGELMIWTDDDVLVDPEWVAEYVKAAREWPEADVFGGEIDPWFESPPPRWVVDNLSHLHAPFVIMTGRTVEPVTRPMPFGANMAFRTSVLRNSPFDPQLGRCGNEMRSGDETGKITELFAGGCSGRWVPGARVKHFVVTGRLKAAYVYRYFCGHQEGHVVSQTSDAGANFPWWAVRMWCESTAIRCLTSITRGDRWIRALKNSAYAHGQLRGYFAKRRANLKHADLPLETAS